MRGRDLARSLAAGENRGRLFLLGLPMVVGWALVLISLQAVLDFRMLFAGEGRWLREDLAIVYREVGLANTLAGRRAFLQEEDLRALREHPAVERISAVGRNNFPAAMRIGGGLLPTLYSEIFFEALPAEFFEVVPEEWEQWSEGQPVPLLVPGQFLHLYNFGFAPGKGLPQISPAMARRVGLEIEVGPGFGVVERFPARIAGFSDQITALHVPWSFLEWANATFSGESSLPPSRAVLTLREGGQASLAGLLEARGLQLDESSRKTARLQTLLVLGIFALLGLGLLVGFLAVLLAFGLVEQRLATGAPELRRLFFLGFSRRQIAGRLVLGQIYTFTGSAGLALLCTLGIKRLLTSQFADGGFVPPAGIAGPVYGVAVGLWAMAVLWGGWRTRRRLRHFVG